MKRKRRVGMLQANKGLLAMSFGEIIKLNKELAIPDVAKSTSSTCSVKQILSYLATTQGRIHSEKTKRQDANWSI